MKTIKELAYLESLNYLKSNGEFSHKSVMKAIEFTENYYLSLMFKFNDWMNQFQDVATAFRKYEIDSKQELFDIFLNEIENEIEVKLPELNQLKYYDNNN